MGQCYITRRGTKTGGATEQLGVYPTGNDGRPIGNVTVLDNVTSLSRHLFIENDNVLTVALPQNLRSLDDYIFQNCTSLQNINIPDKVTAIPQYCFDGCDSLSKVVLPKNLTTINGYAFQNCTGLYDLIIPDEIDSLVIKGYAFSKCQGLDNETVSKLAQLAKGTIYDYAFTNLTGITEVTTSYVYDYYFKGCTNLKKLTVLNPLDNGGFGAYIVSDCTKIKEVVLPDEATIINANMFNGRSSLTTVNIPTSTITIDNNAFAGTSINNIVLPSGLKTVGSSAFQNCSKLTSINIPSACTYIGSYAFQNCTSLANVAVDENTSYVLNTYAFSGCTSLTNESANNIMQHYSTGSAIGTYIFNECTNLTDVEVTRFSSYMFYKCTNLIKAKSLQAYNTGNEVFYNCTKLQEVYIADGTTTIGDRIFYGCTSLKTVYLPSSITTVTNSSLTSTSSSYYVFYNCTSLEDVQLGQDLNMSLRLDVSNNLTVDSMVAMFNSLKDLTGDTAKTLTLGSTNLAKLTDEQKLIATSKNWTLA